MRADCRKGRRADRKESTVADSRMSKGQEREGGAPCVLQDGRMAWKRKVKGQREKWMDR